MFRTILKHTPKGLLGGETEEICSKVGVILTADDLMEKSKYGSFIAKATTKYFPEWKSDEEIEKEELVNRLEEVTEEQKRIRAALEDFKLKQVHKDALGAESKRIPREIDKVKYTDYKALRKDLFTRRN